MIFEGGPRNIDNPSNWDKIDPKFIDFNVERRPLKRDEDNLSMNNGGRHFSYFHYIRCLLNEEKYDKG